MYQVRRTQLAQSAFRCVGISYSASDHKSSRLYNSHSISGLNVYIQCCIEQFPCKNLCEVRLEVRHICFVYKTNLTRVGKSVILTSFRVVSGCSHPSHVHIKYSLLIGWLIAGIRWNSHWRACGNQWIVLWCTQWTGSLDRVAGQEERRLGVRDWLKAPVGPLSRQN